MKKPANKKKDSPFENPAPDFLSKIRVVGVGGSGSNAISRMKKCGISGVELIAVNTDDQDLKKVDADLKVRIGKNLTQGLGTGMNPETGRKSAEEEREKLKEVLKEADMIFITCGLGGGTGTGASPVIAEIAKNSGALTVAIVTKPFSFEGLSRQKIADAGLKKLKEGTDCLISVSNDKLLSALDPGTSVNSAFWICDEILREAVSGISDLIFKPGIINVDFADIKTVMKNSGSAIIGIGRASGEKRAENAARAALKSSLLDVSPKGARGILFNVAGGRDISLSEVQEIGKIITEEVNPESKVIFGVSKDQNLPEGELKVTLIATGF